MSSIENILINRHSKDEMVTFLDDHPNQFEKAIQIALSKKEGQAWRATWLINHCMKKNDLRIQPHTKTLILTLNDKKDGHQRELIKVLGKMIIPEELEGSLFDTCMEIWKSINKSPSSRIVAFNYLVKITKKYPELKNEVLLVMDDYFTETLGRGIKATFKKFSKGLDAID